ncbi:MAG: AraC family transcriptional regulator [Angelakisella sp.]
MIGTYEIVRDANNYPDCWRSKNNACIAHFHSSLEVLYLLKGTMQVTLNGQCYPLRPGQVAISSSYTLHSYETPDSSQSIVLTVPLDFVPSVQKLLTHRRFQNSIVTDNTGGELLHCLTRMTEYRGKQEFSPTVLKGYVYTGVGLLVELAGLEEIENRHGADFSREVLIYIQQNYLSEITIDSVAANFGYSKSRFSHLFSELFGYTFCQYLNVLRCRYAAAQIINENASLIDAAMSAGFQNIRTFYRNFHQVFGVTPSQLLERYQSGRISKITLGLSGVMLERP